MPPLNACLRTCTSGARHPVTSSVPVSVSVTRVSSPCGTRPLSLATRASAHGHDGRAPRQGNQQPPAVPTRPWTDPPQQIAQQPQQPTPSQRLCRVTFTIKYQTGFGRSLKIIGHGPALGSWNLASAPDLMWGKDDVWSVTVDLPQSNVVEYKYAMIDSYGNAVAWQSGNNNVLAVKLNQDEIIVTDNWEGAPSASVASNGTVVPRQNQLLNWASEMEMLLGSSKNELRQSRVELMAARDEARIARSQVDSLRKEVAEYKVIEKRQKTEIEMLQAEVQELRAQQKQSAMGFTAAFETAHSILEDLDLEMGAFDDLFSDMPASPPELIRPAMIHSDVAQEEQASKSAGASDESLSADGDQPVPAKDLDQHQGTESDELSSWRARQRPSFTNFSSPAEDVTKTTPSPPDEDQPPSASSQWVQAGMPNTAYGSNTSSPEPGCPTRPNSPKPRRAAERSSSNYGTRMPVSASMQALRAHAGTPPKSSEPGRAQGNVMSRGSGITGDVTGRRNGETTC